MTPWISNDDDLDALARTLESREPSSDRAEQVRTRVLAGAAVQRQLSRRSLAPFVMAGAAVAAAATVVVWLARDSSSARPTIAAVGAAEYERVHDWPDYVVRLDDGTIAVTVEPLAANERFRVATADAELEVRGTSFDVAAAHTQLASVVVRDGKVEIRLRDHAPVIVAAGQSWTAVTTARRDDDAKPPATASIDATTGNGPTGANGSTTATSGSTSGNASTDRTTTGGATTATDRTPSSTRGNGSTPARIRSAGTAATTGSSSSSATIAARTTTGSTGSIAGNAGAASNNASTATRTANGGSSAPGDSTNAHGTTPVPGEADFRAGWAALRANDFHRALPSFAAACTASIHDALGEDACFWVGATARRAGDPSARGALERFITEFPSSARVAEASALLGWLLYDAGDLDGAERRFQRAEHDRVPAVRDSAVRGLTAIARRRAP